MSSMVLLIPILIPTVCGLLTLRIRAASPRALHIYIECTALVTSVLVWIMLLTLPGDPVILYEYIPGFSLQIGLDGLGRLYAGLVSFMWPFVLLYAFSYMEHDSRQRSFFGFYILTYGAALGACFSSNLFTLFFYYCFCLSRCFCSPQFIKGIQIKWQMKQISFIVGQRTITKMIKWNQ